VLDITQWRSIGGAWGGVGPPFGPGVPQGPPVFFFKILPQTILCLSPYATDVTIDVHSALCGGDDVRSNEGIDVHSALCGGDDVRSNVRYRGRNLD